MRLLATDILENQDITSALNIGSYTAGSERALMIRTFIDDIDGSHDYSIWVTIDRNGAGTAYRVEPITTVSVAAGVTAIAFQTILMPISNSDIARVYIQCAAESAADVDTIVEWWEQYAQFPAGGIEFTYTVTDVTTSLPIEGVECWFTGDIGGTDIVWKGTTDAFGVARDTFDNLPRLDAGTYYVWRRRSGYYFDDPDTEVVS